MSDISRCVQSSSRSLGRRMAKALPLAITLAASLASTPPTQAQTLTVLHSFTGGADGANPATGLTMDSAGNLYGTTYFGGANDFGNVFELKRAGQDWLIKPLYSFTGQEDGSEPLSRLTLARDGTLYGTSGGGQGIGACCGSVFHLQPPATIPRSVLTPWNITLLHHFTGADGKVPNGDLLFDQSGNIYGTTLMGGSNSTGEIFELTPSGGSYTNDVLFSSPASGNETYPWGGLVPDNSGNLYGVFNGLEPSGAVFELSPSGSGWSLNVIYAFTGGSDGRTPYGGLLRDQAGNLYGTTTDGGTGGGGTVFELSPSNGSWIFNVLYSFPSPASPADKLTFDTAGNLYGITQYGGTWGWGMVYKLIPPSGGHGQWSYVTLYNFTGGNDGGEPFCSLILDSNGNLYGTTNRGGSRDEGVAFELTP
jgi:uncharacterized repeat protein (TIGR03803 family)